MFQQHGREFNTKVDAKFDKHTKELDQEIRSSRKQSNRTSRPGRPAVEERVPYC